MTQYLLSSRLRSRSARESSSSFSCRLQHTLVPVITGRYIQLSWTQLYQAAVAYAFWSRGHFDLLLFSSSVVCKKTTYSQSFDSHRKT